MVQIVPYEWYELKRAAVIPKVDREQLTPIVYISPMIRGKWYLATGESDQAIEEILIADIVFDCGSTCPTLFVVWDKKIFYANERNLWYPDPEELE